MSGFPGLKLAASDVKLLASIDTEAERVVLGLAALRRAGERLPHAVER
jgi:hypothetical protein